MEGQTTVPDDDLTSLPLYELKQRCIEERAKFRMYELADPRYCHEVFRRALTVQDSTEWEALCLCFYIDVRRWVISHPARPAIMDEQAIQEFVSDTFSRFFLRARQGDLTFPTLAAALNFLKRCTNSVLLDAKRTQMRDPEPIGNANEIVAPDDLATLHSNLNARELWAMISETIINPVERELVHLLWIRGYKPREIAKEFGEKFGDIVAIRQMQRRVIEHLQRKYRNHQPDNY